MPALGRGYSRLPSLARPKPAATAMTSTQKARMIPPQPRPMLYRSLRVRTAGPKIQWNTGRIMLSNVAWMNVKTPRPTTTPPAVAKAGDFNRVLGSNAMGPPSKKEESSGRHDFRNALEDPGQDRVGPHPFGLRLEVQDETVAQRGIGRFAQVAERDIVPPLHQGEDLAREDERLDTARAGAVPEVLARDLAARLVRMGGEHEPRREFFHVGGDGHLARERPHLDDVGAAEHVVDPRRLRAGRAVDDLDEPLEARGLHLDLVEKPVDLR